MGSPFYVNSISVHFPSPVPDSSLDALIRKKDLEQEQNAKALLKSVLASDRQAEKIALRAQKETEKTAKVIINKLTLDDNTEREKIIKLAKERELELQHAVTLLE